MKKKVIVGMSGGVDSSVTAWLLLEQGYEVEGLFMKNWEEDDRPGFCAAEKDLKDAKAVCEQLKISLHSINFSKIYWDKVFQYFLEEYEQGRTPNPDILCNKEIKFKAFLDHAFQLEADYIATGHYAKILRNADGKAKGLFKAKDRDKDQSYFLQAIHPAVLDKTLFPLGDYLKTEVRQFAKNLGLVTSDKKDSTGICFIGERHFKSFLKEYILAKPGEIRSSCGQILGNHEGLMFYTLGQRQGLNLGGQAAFAEAPWYVVDKDLAYNNLIVAQGKNHPLLYAQGLLCSPIHWLGPTALELPLSCAAKIRYRQVEQACLISPLSGEKHCVLFSSPQRAITPGQYVAFYQKNQCLGGAVIEGLIR